jgi:hypothetical protein
MLQHIKTIQKYFFKPWFKRIFWLYTLIRGKIQKAVAPAPENRLPNRAASLGAVPFFAVAAVGSSDPHGGTLFV